MIFANLMWIMWKSIVMHIYHYRIIDHIRTPENSIAYFSVACIYLYGKYTRQRKSPFSETQNTEKMMCSFA